jgi:hypothetical protein
LLDYDLDAKASKAVIDQRRLASLGCLFQVAGRDHHLIDDGPRHRLARTPLAEAFKLRRNCISLFSHSLKRLGELGHEPRRNLKQSSSSIAQLPLKRLKPLSHCRLLARCRCIRRRDSLFNLFSELRSNSRRPEMPLHHVVDNS